MTYTPIDPPFVRAHPWVATHVADPELLDPLLEPALLGMDARELFTSIVTELGDVMAVPGSPAAELTSRLALETGPGGNWSDSEEVLSLLFTHVREYLAYSSNHLAAASGLLRSGEYLYSLAPLVRASIGCSTTVPWILGDQLSVRQLVARAMVDRLRSLQFQVDSTSPTADLGARSSLKKMNKLVGNYFEDDEICRDSGWGKKASLCDQSLPGLEARCEAMGVLMNGQTKQFKRIYGSLSLLSHPNITQLESLRDNNGYFIDVEGLRLLLFYAQLCFGLSLGRAVAAFGWASPDVIEQWQNRVEEVFAREISAGSSSTG